MCFLKLKKEVEALLSFIPVDVTGAKEESLLTL